MAKANACVTHGLPCVHMHVNVEVYKRVRKPVRRGGEQKKGKEGKKRRKKEKEREERETERGEQEFDIPIVENWLSDGQNSSDQEVKSVSSMRATLQDVEILPSFVSK